MQELPNRSSKAVFFRSLKADRYLKLRWKLTKSDTLLRDLVHLVKNLSGHEWFGHGYLLEGVFQLFIIGPSIIY